MADSSDIKHVSDTSLWIAVHRASEGMRPDAMYQDPLALVLAGDRGVEIAKDMAIPTFRYWIQDYRRGGFKVLPSWFKSKLKSAPFRFTATDWFGFLRSEAGVSSMILFWPMKRNDVGVRFRSTGVCLL